MNDRIYLVDGSGYIFRAYFATPPLTNKKGFPTNALFAFTRMMIKLLEDADSDNVVMIFDAGKETFRNELYPEYKANRSECPEDLVPQMPYFRKIAEALGMTPLEMKGYEADDLIGTLTKRCREYDKEVVIVSADKDLMQLVDKKVTIWDTMRDRKFGPKEVKKKMGVPPEKVREFLALTGDSSDNIPGMKGVGPKTAVQLIELFGDVETILQSADAIAEEKGIRGRKKISEQIEYEADTVRLSKELVTIKDDVPVKVSSGDALVEMTQLNEEQFLGAMLRAPVRSPLLEELVEELEFHSLVKDLDINTTQTKSGEPIQGATYELILADRFEEWVSEFQKQEEFCFDVETNALDPLTAELVGVAFSWSDNKAYYIPFSHKDSSDKQVSLDRFRELCAAQFSNQDVTKVGQNLKFDIQVMTKHAMPVHGPCFDTMIAAYLLEPEGGSYGLDALAKKHLSHRMVAFSDLVEDDQSFADVPLDKASHYASEDAHATWLLKDILKAKLDELGLADLNHSIEAPLVPVIASMEREGILLDKDFLTKMSVELGASLAKLEASIYELSGTEFNTNSPKQLSEILFERLGIPTKGVKKTKTGYSTNQAVLEKLKGTHPIIEKILEYRTWHKLKSTYVDALPAQISEASGRLHSHFNQTVTATGRLSSSNPNLQNIPIQTEEGRRVRKAFIAPEGKVLLSADYSQIELRILAHMSGDENLIAAFQNDVDIHEQTTREILQLDKDEPVDPADRRIGKTINFGIIYGMSGFRLAKDLGIPVSVANEYIENYFAQYPAVSEYYEKLEEQLDAEGYVETLYGRKRFLSQIDTSGRDAGFVKRAALNAPLQGTAADIIKKAMLRVHGVTTQTDFPLTLLLQIHDELVLECDEQHAEDAMKLVREEMEGVDNLAIPLKVDINAGKNWDEAH